MKKLILSAIVLSMAATSVMAEDAAEDANKHWTKSGNASLQFTQGYISKNWYKGGVSSFALLGTADYTFNYKYEKFAWDNAIEAPFGCCDMSGRGSLSIRDVNSWSPLHRVRVEVRLESSSRFWKRTNSPRNLRRTSPTEPLRCLAMMISARPRRSLPFSSSKIL